MFRPVRVTRASEDVVEQIKSEIFSGRLTAGDKLPSEKDLAEQFRLSRVTVRDALRVLESHGLIEVKVGAGGGTFIANPSIEPLTRTFSNLLRLQQVSLPELIEARKIIEVATVELAAKRATAEEIRLLEAALAGAKDALAAGDLHYMPHSVEFHVALALAAHNHVLLFTVNSFRNMFYDVLEKLLPSEHMAKQAARDHQQILEAIKARDPALAKQLMLRHLKYFEEQVRAKTARNSKRGEKSNPVFHSERGLSKTLGRAGSANR